jgi:hypothetical protein
VETSLPPEKKDGFRGLKTCRERRVPALAKRMRTISTVSLLDEETLKQGGFFF